MIRIKELNFDRLKYIIWRNGLSLKITYELNPNLFDEHDYEYALAHHRDNPQDNSFFAWAAAIEIHQAYGWQSLQTAGRDKTDKRVVQLFGRKGIKLPPRKEIALPSLIIYRVIGDGLELGLVHLLSCGKLLDEQTADGLVRLERACKHRVLFISVGKF